MLHGLLLIQPKVHRDERGLFLELFQHPRYQSLGIQEGFVQDNYSFSKKGVIRGMHFQRGQAKLVTCTKGEILDVAVDIRPHSPTFKQYEMVHLSQENHRQFFIPEGFAHGFCVLSDEAHLIYKLSSLYHPELEGGFRYDDPEVGIAWPIINPILSERDRKAPFLKELKL